MAGAVVMGVSAAMMGALDNIFLFFIAVALNSIGTGVLTTSLTSVYSKIVPVGQRGAFIGLHSSLDAIVRILMPTLGGLLLQLHPAGPYHFSGLSLLLFSFYLMNHPCAPHSPPESTPDLLKTDSTLESVKKKS